MVYVFNSSTASGSSKRRYFFILSKMHLKAMEVRDDGHLVIQEQSFDRHRQHFYEDGEGFIRCRANDNIVSLPQGLYYYKQLFITLF